MSDSSNNPHQWIGALGSAVSGLQTQQLRELAALLDPGRPVTLSAGQLQRALSLPTAMATGLARDLDRLIRIPGATLHDMQTVITTLTWARVSAGTPADAVEIACTAPSRFGVPLRTTYATALEMVTAAKNDILLVGYVFTAGAKALLEQVASASRDRRIRVTVIGNRMEEHLPALRAVWLPGDPEPEVFSFPPNPHDEMASLHAKALICDSSTALITSANFSHHGLHENIEIGVKISSPAVARLAEFFNSVIVTGHAIPITWK